MIKKIMVVDDDSDIIMLLESRLKRNGYAVVTAFDGMEAYEQIKKEPPDLIIADLMMPNLNGWQLRQQLKDHESYKKIPIILLSALVDKDNQPGLLDDKECYLSKPYDVKELLTKIKEFLDET